MDEVTATQDVDAAAPGEEREGVESQENLSEDAQGNNLEVQETQLADDGGDGEAEAEGGDLGTVEPTQAVAEDDDDDAEPLQLEEGDDDEEPLQLEQEDDVEQEHEQGEQQQEEGGEEAVGETYEEGNENEQEADGADQVVNTEDIDNQMAQLDGEAESDDEETFKEKLCTEIRNYVFGLVFEEMLTTKTKSVLKVLKKKFGPKKVKKHKQFAKAQIRRETKRRMAQENDGEDEQDDEAYEEEVEPVVRKKRSRRTDRGKKTKRARLGPPKAKSAYIFFTTDEKVVAKIKEMYPNERGPDLFRRKAELWRNTSEEEKAEFLEMAARDKERYQQELAEFRRNNPELVEQAEREKRERARERREQRRAEGGGGKRRRRRGADGEYDEGQDELDDYQKPNVPLTHLEEVVKRLKNEKRKKKKKVDEMTLAEDAKEFCRRMREACDFDRELINAGEPAVNKLKMLEEVVNQLRKCSMETERMEMRNRNATSVRQLLQEAGFFSCIRDWLEIMPNGALPHQRIRHELYNAMANIKISEDDLKDTENDGDTASAGNGLAKVLMRLWAHKSETREGRKVLRVIIQRWMRDIANRTDNYGALEEMEKKRFRQIQERRRILGSNKRERVSSSNFNKTVMPMRAVFDYARRPQNNTVIEDRGEDRRGIPEGSARDRILKTVHGRGKAKRDSLAHRSLYHVDITGKSS